MNKYITAGLVGLAFTLSACGGSSSAPVKDTVVSQSTDSTPTPTLDNVDTAFVQTVREKLPVTALSDENIILLGHNICHAFDSGLTAAAVLQIGVDNGLSPYDIGYVVGASTAAYCPQYNSLM